MKIWDSVYICQVHPSVPPKKISKLKDKPWKRLPWLVSLFLGRFSHTIADFFQNTLIYNTFYWRQVTKKLLLLPPSLPSSLKIYQQIKVQTHTQAPTISLSVFHTHTNTKSLSLSVLLYLTHTLSLSLSLSLFPLSLKFYLSFSLSLVQIWCC